MGFFDNLAYLSNYYNVFKSTVHGVRSAGDFINEKLNRISSIHYLGSMSWVIQDGLITHYNT